MHIATLYGGLATKPPHPCLQGKKARLYENEDICQHSSNKEFEEDFSNNIQQTMMMLNFYKT